MSVTSVCNNESFAADSGSEVCMGGAIFRPSGLRLDRTLKSYGQTQVRKKPPLWLDLRASCDLLTPEISGASLLSTLDFTTGEGSVKIYMDHLGQQHILIVRVRLWSQTALVRFGS